MINEVLEAQDYLEGKNIVKGNLHRIIYLMAKLHLEQGKTRSEVRKEIFDWGKKYNVHIDLGVNNIIDEAADNKMKLRDNVVVRIAQKDVDEINALFDRMYTKNAALAILCYAKAYSNKNKEFTVSSYALAAWMKVDRGYLKSKSIKEMIDYGYISTVENSARSTWSKKGNLPSATQYRMTVPFHSGCEYTLQGNDIRGLCELVFGK